MGTIKVTDAVLEQRWGGAVDPEHLTPAGGVCGRWTHEGVQTTVQERGAETMVHKDTSPPHAM